MSFPVSLARKEGK